MGANRYQFDVQSLDRAVCTLFGKVVFGGSGAVSSTDCMGFDVAKVAATTGVYRCTLEDKWQALAGVSLAIDNAGTAADVKAQILNVDLANKQVDIQIVGGAVAADATSGHELYITLHFRNSSVPRKGSS